MFCVIYIYIYIYEHYMPISHIQIGLWYNDTCCHSSPSEKPPEELTRSEIITISLNGYEISSIPIYYK